MHIKCIFDHHESQPGPGLEGKRTFAWNILLKPASAALSVVAEDCSFQVTPGLAVHICGSTPVTTRSRDNKCFASHGFCHSCPRSSLRRSGTRKFVICLVSTVLIKCIFSAYSCIYTALLCRKSLYTKGCLVQIGNGI